MKYTYGKEDLKRYLIDNIDLLLNDPKFQALIVEVKVADDAGNTFVNKAGHDELSKDNLRIETKFTNYIMPMGEMRINSAGENKYGGFDVIRIIDGINKRIFEIPHDEYFNKGNFYGNEFRWSSSYNSQDRKQVGNTQLLLKYETTNK